MRQVLGPTLVVLLLGLLGCSARPTEEECKKAIANMQKIYKYDGANQEAETLAFVRKCRARSSKDNVTCLINATTESDIDVCNRK